MDLTELLRAVETEVGRVNHAAQVAEGERDFAVRRAERAEASAAKQFETVHAITVERDRLTDSLAVVTADRDRLAAEVAALRDRHEGRVPAGPVRALVAEAVGLAAATGDAVIAARWQVFAAAALAKIAEAEPGGGVRRADPLIPILRQQVLADGLLAAADVDARLAAAGLV